MLICSVPTISRVLLRLCAPADYVIRLLDLSLHSFFLCVCLYFCVFFSVCICFLFTCTLCTIFIINKLRSPAAYESSDHLKFSTEVVFQKITEEGIIWIKEWLITQRLASEKMMS